MDRLLSVLGIVANVIQVGSFVFLLYLLWRTRRQLAQHLALLKAQTSSKPMALAIGLGNDIQGAVKQYLESHGLNLPVENFYREGFVPAEQFPGLLQDLRRVRNRLTDLGVTEVHLFYAGPVPFAIALGAALHNWVPVKLYEYRAGKYNLTMILTKESVLGFAPPTVTDTGEAVVRSL